MRNDQDAIVGLRRGISLGILAWAALIGVCWLLG
jgi:hypothetical protein